MAKDVLLQNRHKPFGQMQSGPLCQNETKIQFLIMKKSNTRDAQMIWSLWVYFKTQPFVSTNPNWCYCVPREGKSCLRSMRRAQDWQCVVCVHSPTQWGSFAPTTTGGWLTTLTQWQGKAGHEEGRQHEEERQLMASSAGPKSPCYCLRQQEIQKEGHAAR